MLEDKTGVTYLCGGINGLNDQQCNDWRNQAKALLVTETLDPMRRDYRGKENQAITDELVQSDLKDIQDSDYLLVNATKPSWGTGMELVYAYEYGKAAVAFIGKASVSPWLLYHCEVVVQTLEEAVEIINSYEKDNTW